MHYPQLTSKSLCLSVTIALGLELIIFVLASGNGTAAISALISAAFAYLTGKKLRDPHEIPSPSQAFISSLPALFLLVAGIIILASSILNWGLWLSITLGFMIGNRTKAAGVGERIPR